MRLLALFLIFLSQPTLSDFDWSDYSELLNNHVASGERNEIQSNLVSYQGIADDPRYLTTLEALATYNPGKLRADDKKAFYINAYNLMAIKMVIDHMPIKSIKDAGSWFSPVWQKPVGIINNQTVSLDQIEHKILRKMADPRIHFAIVCASMSCPDLLAEAYSSDKLDNQLNQQAKDFLSNRSKGMLIKGNSIYLSKIFNWFEEDFAGDNGSERDVLKYIAQFHLEAGRFDEFKTLDYNWRLNKQ